MEKGRKGNSETSENTGSSSSLGKHKWKKKRNQEMQGARPKSKSPQGHHPPDVVDDASAPDPVSKGEELAVALRSGVRREKSFEKERSPTGRLHCSYCNVYFSGKLELQTHCRGQDHQTTIMSDEGRDWKHRPPPRGLGADEYALCSTYKDTHNCRLGDQCVGAHSDAELLEWQERFEYRAMKLERAREKQLHGATYADQLLERLSQAQHQDALISEKIDAVVVNMSMEPNLRVSQKPSQHEWTINLRPNSPLRVVSLVHDAHRTHFAISEVTQIDNHRHIHKSYEPENNQEWINPDMEAVLPPDMPVQEYKVTIVFKTAIYGTFRQAVIFDFGTEPVLMQRLCVDVIPVEDLSALEETKRTILTRSERWCEENVDIVYFEPKPHELSDHDKSILAMYPPPTNENFVFTQSSMQKVPSRNNYCSRLHDLLHIEELAQFDLMARFNIKTTLQIVNTYMLLPSTASTAKYSRPGELFAKLELSSEISEDSHHGRLVLSNCNTILVAPVTEDSEVKETSKQESSASGSPTAGRKEGESEEKEILKPKRRIYEVLIEDKTKKEIYLRFSEAAVSELHLAHDEEVTVEVQFQLNRLPLCEMHSALDRLPSLDIVFPDMTLEPTIPWSPIKQWGEGLDMRLNPKQKEALVAITAPHGLILPPILIIGPYGTGKTYTLAQGIKQILQQPDTRILICTHSNSAADLYIKDYLHPYVQSGHEEAKPLRIYYRNRWVTTVHSSVQKYCLIEMDQGVRKFVMPTEKEILAHRVIVATLNTSRYLASLNLEKGVFTHILIDEAAQAMECEALTPMALVRPDTRIVLAGDYMQLSPEVFSPFCEERGLGMSLLERLYDLYPADSPCKIMLVENYRSHSAIIKYTSDLFYEGRLVASGKQTAHPKFHPLTFFTARGEDFQDPNSTAFYNNSEVYEVCEQVGEIISHWPKKEWGPLGENSIGVVTPYADQMVRIRAELRKRKLYKINVERVLNVQGKQFRVIVLSTVRTRHTCKPGAEGLDFGFLSNAKLLTTAITRAQSLVAVVGDPVSLCSVGKCRKLWEKFLQLCSEAGSLYGISWSTLRSQLDGVELKKTYVLNPLAPEFVPRCIYYSIPPVPMVHTMPPYVNMYSPYNSYIPTYHMRPMLGPQALPYLPQPGMPSQWSPVHYGAGAKTPLVRPAAARLGQPLIASHPLRSAVVTATHPHYMDPHGYDYQLHNNMISMYPYQTGSFPHRLPAMRHPAELDPFTCGAFLPPPYQHIRPVPQRVVPPIGFRGPSFGRAMSLPPHQLGRLTPHSEGEKSYQFLNNVHFPERQLSNPPSVIARPVRSRADTESPMSSHSRESSHSSANDSRHSSQSQPQQHSQSHVHPQVEAQKIPLLGAHLQYQSKPQAPPNIHIDQQGPPMQQLRQQTSHHQMIPQPHPHSNGSVPIEDAALPTPDVVRSINELINDHSPTKTASLWGSVDVESNNKLDLIQSRCRSPTGETWLGGNSSNSIKAANLNMSHPNPNPWSGTPTSVGKIVTVQELEASLHMRKYPSGNMSSSGLNKAPGPLPFSPRELEKNVHIRENEEVGGGFGKGDVPPPPGFSSLNRMVDPLVRLDLNEGDPVGYRTPSLPLYLRRGSRESSSCSPGGTRNAHQSSVVGSMHSNNHSSSLSSLWNIGREEMNPVSSQGELGLQNLSLSLGISPIGALNPFQNSQDSKTYAGVVRSSLQSSDSEKGEECEYALKDLGDKRLYTSNNHLYQHFQ
ncbi:probable helicase with zinc finger domain isoform X2 [Penaeus indicus]|uniref:probable helicase with zinc finger domain isoform X2 n=1 Tax=Penaeus indicus TaxID=29960 RepID=UPI00300C5102